MAGLTLTLAEKRRKIAAQQKKVIARQPRIPVGGVDVPVASRTKEEFQRRPITSAEQRFLDKLPGTDPVPKQEPESIPGYKPLEGKSEEEEIEGTPSKFRKAMGTIRDRVAARPAPVQRSSLFNKARENIQRQSEGPSFPDTFGSMYIKDPVTGKNIPTEGYYNEAGTFIRGARTKMKDIGSLVNYNIRGVSDPKLRETIARGITKQAGVLDPETGRIGSELARRGEQTLSHIRGRYAENIARMGGEYGVEEAGILSEGRDRTTTPVAQFAHRPTEEGSTTYSKFTGRDVGDETELPEHVLKNARALKQKSQKEFDEWAVRQDAATRQRLKALGF